MTNILEYYHNLKMQYKLMVAFTLVTFIPLIFVGVFLTTQMKAMALSESIKASELELDRVTSEAKELLLFNDTLQSAILADSGLYPVINAQYTSTLQIFLAYQAYYKMSQFEEIYEEVDDIRIYVDNPTMLNNMDFMTVTGEVRKEKWYKEAINNEDKSYAGYYYDSTNKKSYLVLSRAFSYRQNQTGVIMSLIPVDAFMSMIAYEDMPFQILDGAGYVVASLDRQDIGYTLYDTSGLYGSAKGLFWQDEYKEEEAHFLLEEISLNRLDDDLYVIAVIPLERILHNANAASRLGFSVIGASLFLATAFIFIFSRLLTTRIKSLETSMNQVAKGHFSKVKVLDGDDEIGKLSQNLNIMAGSLATLIQKNEAMILKEKAYEIAHEQTRFELLASQINPHFLFNVLETIRMKAHIEGQDELSEVVHLLGVLMRRSIEMSEERITVEEEMTFVKGYIHIQLFRFGNRFEFESHIADDINPIKIPPLLIQPIVENAVIHGMESIAAGGKIQVLISKRDDKLTIIIKDNGIGIPEEKLSDLQKGIYETERKGRKHIGIRNVHERIVLKYGPSYGVDINSIYHEGTQVQVTLPIIGEE